MRAVILVAGKGWRTNGFQLGTKPKCLHSINGKNLLQYNIDILNKAGIDEIEVVIGYRGKLIERYIKDAKIKVKLIYNHNWRKSAIYTLKAAFQGSPTDTLLIYGDTLLDKSLIEDIVNGGGEVGFITSQKKQVNGMKNIDIFRNNMLDSGIYKINKTKFNIFKDTKKVERETEEFLREFHGFSHADRSGGVTLSIMIKLIMLKSKSIDLIYSKGRYEDFDYFYETDEHKENKWKIYFTAYPLYKFMMKYNIIKLLKKMKILDLVSSIKKKLF